MYIADALLYSLLGISVVFFALLLLMIIIKLLFFFTKGKNITSVNSIPDSKPNNKVLAPGSIGDIKLYDTDPRTAAMIMAIVADELGVPLNELRFISIREIKQ